MAETGLHHVTAFAGDPARNRDFYTRVLGLRLVKTTVNFDDPRTYHLYYGDETGRPGTILTFFSTPQGAPGRTGSGETRETALRVPRTSLDWWADRLAAHGAPTDALESRFDEPTLRFRDPDGMRLALVGVAREGEAGWTAGEVPAAHAICGLHGVTLLLRDSEATARILTDVLGLRDVGRHGAGRRFAGTAAMGACVTLETGDEARGHQGAGSVHHVAFRAADDRTQAAMAERLTGAHGLHVTEQRDRTYFRSVYAREPGGVLFEIATDAPGFTVDEPVGALGHALKLPATLEPRRDAIERALPPLL